MRLVTWAQGFLPSTLQGWLQVIVGYGIAVFGILAAVWAVLTKPLRELVAKERRERLAQCKTVFDRLDELRKRVANVADSAHALEGKVAVVERNLDRSDGQASHMHEHIGRIDAEIEALTQIIRRLEQDKATDMRQISDRLTRMETTLTFLAGHKSG